ncbi:hypothetical protein SAMN04490243_2126 [Robiginitalea myxolifaciens]|uniref:Uncharacterized protein n=1 Tax=Robiginitalea myxolifaciens TaxID=400055 RepID=A0A1I6H2D9_9FLAO|nr:hypothetical protein SAMN04490243_2126 [Robiginitalea myxolifaciens]
MAKLTNFDQIMNAGRAILAVRVHENVFVTIFTFDC